MSDDSCAGMLRDLMGPLRPRILLVPEAGPGQGAGITADSVLLAVMAAELGGEWVDGDSRLRTQFVHAAQRCWDHADCVRDEALAMACLNRPPLQLRWFESGQGAWLSRSKQTCSERVYFADSGYERRPRPAELFKQQETRFQGGVVVASCERPRVGLTLLADVVLEVTEQRFGLSHVALCRRDAGIDYAALAAHGTGWKQQAIEYEVRVLKNRYESGRPRSARFAIHPPMTFERLV